MGKFDKLKKENKQINESIIQEASHFQEVADEYNRVADTYHAPMVILKDIDREFARATKLNDVDISFLLFATALQCTRQYLQTKFTMQDDRPNDNEAASKTPGHRKTHSDRGIYYYDPSFNEIKENPVPFDANEQEEHIKGVFKGTGHFGHRTTLGHDPILGWIVGTSNIATSTLTTWDFQSYHVKTGKSKRDKMIEKADTMQVFAHTGKKLLAKEGHFINSTTADGKLTEHKLDKIAGPSIIALSLIKEWEHLRSDVNSKKSLPFPLVTAISPEFSGKLAKYGIDMCNIGTAVKQATYAALINAIVAMIHRMLYDEGCGLSQSMYEEKTRKILTYSNVIASASNVIWVGGNMLAGNEMALKDLDVGGLAVTLHRLISDYKFIKEVKLEFMEKQWYDIVLGDDYEFMKEEK